MWNYVYNEILLSIYRNLITYNGELFKNLLIATSIILVGWAIGKILALLIKFILKIIHFDDICDKLKITSVLEKVGIHNIPSNTVAGFFYWVILLVAFLSAVDLIIDVSAFQTLQKIISFIPLALLALFIFIIGLAFAYFIGKIIGSIAVSSGVRQSTTNFLEKLIFWVIIIFSIKIALNVIKINDDIILVFVNDIFKYVFIGFAIAFGLGVKNFAEDFLAYYKIKSAFPPATEIELDGTRAIVKEIKLFHTLLYTETGIIDIPNAKLSRAVIKKVS